MVSVQLYYIACKHSVANHLILFHHLMLVVYLVISKFLLIYKYHTCFWSISIFRSTDVRENFSFNSYFTCLSIPLALSTCVLFFILFLASTFSLAHLFCKFSVCSCNLVGLFKVTTSTDFLLIFLSSVYISASISDCEA